MRFRAKACPALDAGWIPVRVKKTHQNNNPEPRSDLIGTEKAPVQRVAPPPPWRPARWTITQRFCVTIARLVTLTFRYRDGLQLSEHPCLRVRLTGSLDRGFNLWRPAFR